MGEAATGRTPDRPARYKTCLRTGSLAENARRLYRHFELRGRLDVRPFPTWPRRLALSSRMNVG